MPSQNADLKVQIKGSAIALADIFEIHTDHDKDQPDMAAVSLSNINGERSAQVVPGDELAVMAGGTPIFKGDIIGIEPWYDHDMPSRVMVRALNRMHRLARGRKSRSFEKQSDAEIVQKVCQEAGLSAKCDSTSIKYDHVYQHNQTDLEFIRQRASRIGFEVWVEDKTLYFVKHQTKNDSGLHLEFGKSGDSDLVRFRPRMSTAHQVSKVVCRGWDPIKKKEIVGIATPKQDLGGKSGSQVANQLMSNVELHETSRPIHTQEEADAIAQSILKERLMSFITAEALCYGLPTVKIGQVVSIDVPDSRFKGKYYVVGVRHRYIHSTAQLGGVAHKEAGYKTLLKLQRDAES